MPWIWRRLGAEYAVYTALVVLIPLSQRLESLGRYMCVAFPVFIVLAVLLEPRPVIRQLVLAGSTTLLVPLTMLFATGRWVI
jgi:Sec-independent protein secretion pathway component TatC